MVHGHHKAYNLTAMYAPMLDTILQGLRSKEEQCSYRTVAVLPKHLSENGNYGVLEAGDVILHIGLEYEENFTRRCQEEFAPNVYCILFQTEHRSIQAPQGLCEVWEYTRANRPTAPVVRYVPPGFLPLEVTVAENDRQPDCQYIFVFLLLNLEYAFTHVKHITHISVYIYILIIYTYIYILIFVYLRDEAGKTLYESVSFRVPRLTPNSRQVQQAAASLAAFGGKRGLQWIFVGSMPRKRRSCWQHLRAMPELGHVQFRHVSWFANHLVFLAF